MARGGNRDSGRGLATPTRRSMLRAQPGGAEEQEAEVLARRTQELLDSDLDLNPEQAAALAARCPIHDAVYASRALLDFTEGDVEAALALPEIGPAIAQRASKLMVADLKPDEALTLAQLGYEDPEWAKDLLSLTDGDFGAAVEMGIEPLDAHRAREILNQEPGLSVEQAVGFAQMGDQIDDRPMSPVAGFLIKLNEGSVDKALENPIDSRVGHLAAKILASESKLTPEQSLSFAKKLGGRGGVEAARRLLEENGEDVDAALAAEWKLWG